MDRNNIILIGGGTGQFLDRPNILKSDPDYSNSLLDGLNRAIARYQLERKTF